MLPPQYFLMFDGPDLSSGVPSSKDKHFICDEDAVQGLALRSDDQKSPKLCRATFTLCTTHFAQPGLSGTCSLWRLKEGSLAIVTGIHCVTPN